MNWNAVIFVTVELVAFTAGSAAIVVVWRQSKAREDAPEAGEITQYSSQQDD